MKSFPDFFTELKDDQIWTENASMYWKPETFEKCARQVWMQGVADGILKPIQECRKHVFNIVKNLPHDRAKVDWTKKALEKLETEKKEEWKPVSWEKRAEYLKQVQAEIDKIDDKRIRPLFDGEAETNGQFDPPKPKAKCAPSAPVEIILEHIDKVNTARRKFYLERNPGASEEEIKEYLKKFEMI